jgi:hypothetical protein
MKNATQTAAKTLEQAPTVRPTVRNVSVSGIQYGRMINIPNGGGKRMPFDKFVEQQKEATKQYVAVEDRGQFQYTDNKSGNIVETPDLTRQLKEKESLLNINKSGELSSYIVPAELKIKRNWSVSGPGGVGIRSMNINEPTSFARTDQSARKPNVRSVGGKILFG